MISDPDDPRRGLQIRMVVAGKVRGGLGRYQGRMERMA
jgi:hypothetical protein